MSKLTFYKPPEIQKGYIFNPQKSFFSVVVPEATTNLIYNPETQHLNDFSTSENATIELDIDTILFGTSSIEAMVPVDEYVNYDLITSLVPDTIYTFSVYMKGYGAVRLAIYNETDEVIQTTGRVINLSPDVWGRYILKFTTPAPGVMEASSIRIVGVDDRSEFWISGLQLEEKAYATTFCSGNLVGLITGETPRPYFWTATPNQSPSVRLSTTRDGGKIVSLETLGFHVTGFNGLGLPEFDIISTPVASGIGSVYTTSTIESRDIEICGVLTSPNVKDFFCNKGKLSHAMQPNISGNAQPIKLLYSVYECDKQICDQIEILAAYENGLEGETESLLGEEICISFKMLDPLFKALGNNAKTLNVYKQELGAVGPVGTDINGEWQVMTGSEDRFGGASTVGDITIGPDNNLYLGGVATNFGGGDNTLVARWNGTSWDSIGKSYEDDGTTLANGTSVEVIIPGPDGCLYVGGSFFGIGNENGVITVADGDGLFSHASYSQLNIARYRITTNTWEYIGRFLGDNDGGTDDINIVMDMKFLQNGNIWVVGNFKNPQGIDEEVFNLARNIISFDPNTDLMDYAIKVGAIVYNNELGLTDDSIIYSIDQAPNGEVWIGGDFEFNGSLEGAGTPGVFTEVENVAVYGRYPNVSLPGDPYTGFDAATGSLTDGNILGGAVYVVRVSPDGSVWIGGDFTADVRYDTINPAYPPDIEVTDTTVQNGSAAFTVAKLDEFGSADGWFSQFILGSIGWTSGDSERYGLVSDMEFDTDGNLHLVGQFNFANTYFPDLTYEDVPPIGSTYTVLEALATQEKNCNGYIIWDGSNFIQPDILFGDDDGDPRAISVIELGALYNNKFAEHSLAPIPGQFEYHMPGTGGANINPGFNGSIFLGLYDAYDYISKDIVFIDLGCNDYSKPIFVINGPGTLKSIINETTGAKIYFNYVMSLGESLVLDLTQPLFKISSNLRGNLRGVVNPNSTISSFIFNGGTIGVSVNVDLLTVGEDTVTSFVKWKTQYWSADKACNCDCNDIGTYDG